MNKLAIPFALVTLVAVSGASFAADKAAPAPATTAAEAPAKAVKHHGHHAKKDVKPAAGASKK